PAADRVPGFLDDLLLVLVVAATPGVVVADLDLGDRRRRGQALTAVGPHALAEDDERALEGADLDPRVELGDRAAAGRAGAGDDDDVGAALPEEDVGG